MTYKIVSVAGAEYRDGKGKLKDIYGCHIYEMPIYIHIWITANRIISCQKLKN